MWLQGTSIRQTFNATPNSGGMLLGLLSGGKLVLVVEPTLDPSNGDWASGGQLQLHECASRSTITDAFRCS